MSASESDDELREMVAALAEEVRTLRAQLERRERDEPTTEDVADDAADLDAPSVTSRRGLLALAGGVAAVAAGAVLGSSQPAAAANGDAIKISATTTATATSVTRTLVDYSQTTGVGDYFVVTDAPDVSTPPMNTVLGAYNAVGPNNIAIVGQSTRNNGVGVTGEATGGDGGIGVTARATGGGGIAAFALASGLAVVGVYADTTGTIAGVAVIAKSGSRPDVAASGTGGVWMKERVSVGPPTTASVVGEFVRDGKNDLWVCTGTSPVQWRRVATVDDLTATNAQVTALSAQVGAIGHPASLILITPTRVYDSRLPNQPPGNTGGTIATGQSRVVSIANGINLDSGAVSVANVVPAGATGIVCNFTVAGPQGGGFLAMTPGDAGALSASTINWTAGTANLANAATVKLDSNRQVKVFAGGGASTDFIIDIAGYYI